MTHTGRIGVLPQDPQALFVKNTVRQDLYESFDGTDLPKDQRDRRVEQVTALCRLTELLDRHPYDLSGGEQQRAALGKVLLHQPDILLLDEPTNDIDVNTLRALEEGLDDFAGCAVVISHDRWFLDRICTHILAFEGNSEVFFFEGSYSEYEENKMKRLGNEEPKRVRYRKLMED